MQGSVSILIQKWSGHSSQELCPAPSSSSSRPTNPHPSYPKASVGYPRWISPSLTKPIKRQDHTEAYSRTVSHTKTSELESDCSLQQHPIITIFDIVIEKVTSASSRWMTKR